MGRDQDDVILIPITTARSRIVGKSGVQAEQVGRIYVKFDAGTDLAEGQEEIERLMRSRRRGGARSTATHQPSRVGSGIRTID